MENNNYPDVLVTELNARITELVTALKKAEGYMFEATQPDQGDLFSKFDDDVMKVLRKNE